MKKLCKFVAQRRNHVTQNNIIKNKAGIGASQNGVTSLFLHPRRLLSNLQNSDKMQRIIHYVKWRAITRFPGYFISNSGVVRNDKGILKEKYNNRGYAYVIISYKGFHDGVMIHKLVHDHFSGISKTKGWEIHHKDNNFLNNHIDNLEYLPKEKHLAMHGRKSHSV